LNGSLSPKSIRERGIGSALCEELLKRFGEMGVLRSNSTQRELKVLKRI